MTHAHCAADASVMCRVHHHPRRTSHPLCGGPLLSANDRAAGVQACRVRVAIQRHAIEEQRAALTRLDGNPFLGARRKVCDASRAQREPVQQVASAARTGMLRSGSVTGGLSGALTPHTRVCARAIRGGGEDGLATFLDIRPERRHSPVAKSGARTGRAARWPRAGPRSGRSARGPGTRP